MRTEVITLDESRNVSLTCYLQEAGGEFKYIAKRPAVLIMPGGAYQYCSAREADPVAFAYLKAGYSVFILRYSVAENCTWPAPLMDYDQAMGMIRDRADEWNIYQDKIAVIGFSAGGHLAGAAATMGMQRPNAAILGYAVLTEDVQACNPTAPDVTKVVDENTPPCFIFANRDDDIVPVMNSVKMMEALADAGVSFESHIYSFGGHGFSTAEASINDPNGPRSARDRNWVEDSIAWLTEVFGEFGDKELKKPVLNPRMNGDTDEYLSVNCTVGKLLSVEGGAAVVKPIFDRMRNPDAPEEEMNPTILKMKLKDVLHFAGAPDSAIEKINEQLAVVKNR